MTETTPTPSPDLQSALSALMQKAPTDWQFMERGYTAANRWIITFADGSTAFVKSACDKQTADWLEAECRVYSSITAPYMPRFFGSGHADSFPFLVLEDLSQGHWPPPWESSHIERGFELLEAIRSTPPPEYLPKLADYPHVRGLGGWEQVLNDPTGFLSLGLVDAKWLAKNGPILLKAEKAAPLDGTELVHWDIRSDNLCFMPERTVVIDWNHACIGNSAFDFCGWLPSLAVEGGPSPWDITTDEPEFAALMAGYFASKAPLPSPRPGSKLREAQLKQLRVALPWACISLGIRVPDPTQ